MMSVENLTQRSRSVLLPWSLASAMLIEDTESFFLWWLNENSSALEPLNVKFHASD